MRQHFAAVGVLLGKLHNISATWLAPPGFKRPRCDAEGIYGTLGRLEQQIEEAAGRLKSPQ